MPADDTQYYMYVVRCADDTLYTGYSTDVHARVAAHNAGNGAKYTHARLPVLLEAYAAFPTKREAMRAEFYFKKLSRAQKEHALKMHASIEEFTQYLVDYLSGL